MHRATEQHVPLLEIAKDVSFGRKLFSKRKIAFTIVLFVAFLIYVLAFIVFNSIDKNIYGAYNINFSKSIESIDDVCLHPKVDFFDPEITRFYREPEKCKGKPKNITYIEKGRLKVWEPKRFDCWGRCLLFHSNSWNEEKPWIHTNTPTYFNCDIIETRCSLKSLSIENATYFYLHTQVVEVSPEPSKFEVPGKQYNVYFITIDSQSYTQTFRNLNKTNQFMLDEMGAIHFKYMNRLASGSRENAIAWWFGKFSHKIDRSVYNLPPIEPEPQWIHDVNCRRYLDDEKFILKEFAEYGYMTSMAEDWYGTMDYECKGFNQTVAHHTYIPYVLAYETNLKLRGFLEKEQCLQRHQPLLHYADQFAKAYSGKPKFNWLWLVHVGHNNEYGSKQADPDLLKLLKDNKEEFDNSFVFIAGDHGMRFTGAVLTTVGKLDVNNPVFMMSVPKELRKNKELMSTLKENSEELQTHFDTRATLLDILKHQPVSNYNDRSIMRVEGEFGHSMLRMQPKPRTCKTLPVPSEFCICKSPLNVNLTATHPGRAERVGQKVINLINTWLNDANVSSLCRTWEFSETKTLTELSKNPNRLQGVVAAKDFDKAAEAQFNVFLSGYNDTSLSLVAVDRLDRYGNNGDCVEKSLRRICHCY